MILFPAIDLKNGQCVRLEQGDFAKQTTFNDDPLAVAKDFEAAGATWLHVIDLDGAKDGVRANQETIRSIVEHTSLNVQVGGGIRSEADVKALLELGVNRVIVGSMAVENLNLLTSLAVAYPGKILVSLDVRDGFVTYKGWQKQSPITTLVMCRTLRRIGIDTIIYTDIATDGMMSGPNLSAYAMLKEATDLNVISSGGVRNIADLKRLQELGLSGAIVGKAIYLGHLDVKEAIICLQDESSPA